MQYRATIEAVWNNLYTAGRIFRIAEHAILKWFPGNAGELYYFPLYFRRVAMPPRICRCCLFMVSTCNTCAYSLGLHFGSLCWRSLCTVDFDIPKCFAAARTVALFSIMYTANWQALSSMVSIIVVPPMLCAAETILCEKGRIYTKKFMENS